MKENAFGGNLRLKPFDDLAGGYLLKKKLSDNTVQ